MAFIKKNYLKVSSFLKGIRAKFLGHSRRKTPIVLQMELAECGAAALGIILGYYGCYVPLEYLRQQCGVSRDGSKAINIVKVARDYGFIAYGAQGDIEALYEIKGPFIAFWQFNHFIVVEDMQKEGIYINDPASGRRFITYSEFDKSFTGVVIVFEPGTQFVKQGKPIHLLDTILGKLQKKDVKRTILFLILLSIALIVPGFMIPGFSKIFVDDVLIKDITTWLPLLILGLILTALLQFIFSCLQQYYLLRFHLKWLITASASFFWHLFRLPIAFFEQRYIGDINDRLEANNRVAMVFANNISASIVSLFSMIFFGLILFLLDWELALIGITASFFNMLVLYFIYDRINVNTQKFLRERGQLSGLEMYGLHSIETLKAGGIENHFFKRWSGNHAKIIDTQQNIALSQLWLASLPSLFTGIAGVLILAVGSIRIVTGDLTIGTLIAFQILLASFNAPINVLLEIVSKIQEIRGDLIRIDDVMQQRQDRTFQDKTFLDESHEKAHERTNEMDKKNVELEESIVMRNVSFGYSPLESPYIKNFNLTLKPKQQLAIVGPTGSGKSTIAKMLTRLYSPWTGEIQLFGKPIESYTPKFMSSVLSMVDQDIVLFEGSIRENITLWDPLISNETISNALTLVEMKQLLALRQGLETKIEEGAFNFSDGEKQRLEIARAILLKPKILILDEGTAFLDTETEQRILSTLRKEGYTLILITHRLSSIIHSDHIIVMNKGEIIEEGDHKNLLARNGLYTQLVSQAL